MKTKTAERRTSIYPLGSAFFGLTTQDRPNIFSQIHEIVFHGKGGYDWETVYNMPIWLRTWTFRKIKEFYDEEKKAHDKALNNTSNKKRGELKRPNIKPSYSTKASNK